MQLVPHSAIGLAGVPDVCPLWGWLDYHSLFSEKTWCLLRKPQTYSVLLWLPKPDFFDQNEVIEVWFRVFWRWITNLSQIFGCFIAPVAAIALPSACVSLSSSTRQHGIPRPCTIHCWWLLAVGIQSVPSCSFWPDSSAGHARTNVGCMFIMIGGSIHPILVSRSLYLHHIASSRRIHIFFTRVSKGTNSIRVSYFHSSHEKYLWKLHTILFTYFPAWSTKHSLSTSSSNQLYRRISQPAIINNISPWFLAISPIYPSWSM